MYTRIHNPASAGAAKGHQALLQGAEDVVHNHSKCGHHAQLRHHTVDIGSTGRCSCREDHEKRCSQKEKPSRYAWEHAAPQVQCRHCTRGEDWLPTPKAGRDRGRSWI